MNTDTANTDAALMRDYEVSGSEASFREIVERYLPLVHSAALRMVNGDTHRAQDIAQTVFADLARKARALNPNAVLANWLWTATHHAAANVIRREQRRARREQTAAYDQELNTMPATETEHDWEQLRPALDQALAELPSADRDAVLLRYFKQRELRAIGQILGLSEDAARKRVSRALDKLHGVLIRRGVTLSATALAATLSAHAVTAAPAGLATIITTTSLATATTAGAGLGLVQLIAMSTKLKIAMAALVAVLFVSGAGYGVWNWRESNRGERAHPVDLSKYFNAAMDDNWVRADSSATNFALLPRGRRVLAGVRFDVGYGLIQLSGRDLRRKNPTFPTNVAEIPIREECRRIHLLHGTMFKIPDGSPLGLLVLNYRGGGKESLMFNYGYHVRDWSPFYPPNTAPTPPKSPTTQVAWTGTNAGSRPGEFQRLFRTTFQNPRPSAVIESVDYVSVMSSSAPFLLALSVD